jgi:DNA-binding transcriptional LysR family regulator
MDMLSAQAILHHDLLTAFLAFSETLNFTRAAQAVGLSQPALFERVQRLSEQLELPLYQRVGRALELTPQGVQLAAYAREAQEHGLRFLHELRGQPRPEEVTLAAGEGSYLYLIGEALRRFRSAGIGHLRLLTLGARDACAAVLSGEAHLAVCALDMVPPRLSADEITRTPMCVTLPRDHRLARRRSLKLRELVGERLILAPAGQLHREFVGRALGRVGFDVIDPIEADGWPLMLRFAQLGLGVAFVNELCAVPEGLILRPVPELGSVTYRLVRRRGARPSPAAERLAQWVRECVPARGRSPSARKQRT